MEKVCWICSSILKFFTDTIISNIAFGEEENKIDMKLLNEIVDICNIREFNQLPKGLETILNEDGKFSGGQLQRIAIARALNLVYLYSMNQQYQWILIMKTSIIKNLN